MLETDLENENEYIIIDWETEGRFDAIRKAIEAKQEYLMYEKALEEYDVVECTEELYNLQELHYNAWVEFQQRYHRLEELGVVRNERFTCDEFTKFANKIMQEYKEK